MIDFFLFLEYYLILIDNGLTKLSLRDPADIPCSNATLVLDSIRNLQRQYNTHINLLFDFVQSLDCGKFNKIYALLAYDGTSLKEKQNLRILYM